MVHKLRVIVRVDFGASISLLVTGCLTDDSCQALLPVIRRALSLLSGHPVTVDLTESQHIDSSALDVLTQSTTSSLSSGSSGSDWHVLQNVTIKVPATLPVHGVVAA